MKIYVHVWNVIMKLSLIIYINKGPALLYPRHSAPWQALKVLYSKEGGKKNSFVYILACIRSNDTHLGIQKMFQLYIYIHKQNKKTKNKIQSIPDLEHCILNLPNTNLSTALVFLFFLILAGHAPLNSGGRGRQIWVKASLVDSLSKKKILIYFSFITNTQVDLITDKKVRFGWRHNIYEVT